MTGFDQFDRERARELAESVEAAAILTGQSFPGTVVVNRPKWDQARELAGLVLASLPAVPQEGEIGRNRNWDEAVARIWGKQEGEGLRKAAEALIAQADNPAYGDNAAIVDLRPLRAALASAGEPAPRVPTQMQTLEWVRERWPDRTDPTWRALKLGEEAGEVQGAVVKMGEGRKSLADLAGETAQLVICAMALAESAGFNLRSAIAAEWERCGVRVWAGAALGAQKAERE